MLKFFHNKIYSINDDNKLLVGYQKEENWQVRKILGQIHHMHEHRKNKVIHQVLDLCDISSTFMRLMLEYFHNELYSANDDSWKLAG